MSTASIFSSAGLPPLNTPFFGPDGKISFPWVQWLLAVEKGRANTFQFYAGTHAQRLTTRSAAANFPNGTIYYESDRTAYYIVNEDAWLYLSGIMAGMQTAIPSDLTATDSGFLFAVEDYDHLLRWNGTGWEFAPGDGGSGYTALFVTNPPPNGWTICNGAHNVPYLDSTGILLTVTVPNIANTYFRQ